jgi:hypothetical protein
MDFAKLRRHVRQQFHARVGHEHIVFNPDAAPIWKICTRLDRKHHAGSYELMARIDVGTPTDDSRVFVHVDTQAVASAVSERLAHSGPRQAIAGRAIDRKP